MTNAFETIEPAVQDDIITPDDQHIPEHIKSLREMQEALNKTHPFGIKIWKPALYRKHRGIDAKTYEDLHQVPGSVKSTVTFGNVLWAVFFGWWISAIYLAIAFVILLPIWLFGIIGYRLCTASEIRMERTVERFKDLSEMNEYIQVLINLAGYIFWPFGKFVAKRVLYQVDNQETQPLMAQCDLDEHDTMPSLPSPFLGPSTTDRNEGRSGSNGTSDEETWSENTKSRAFAITGLWKSLKRVGHSGPSATIFVLVCGTILGPIHYIVSGICFFLILPIPSAKLNYYLLRHLLLHPLQLTSHPCDYNNGMTRTASNASSHPNNSNQPERNARSRPYSVFFWNSDTTYETNEPKDEESLLPTIMATPSLNPIPITTSAPQNREYQIVLCMYRAMGFEYLKYTAFGVNIIFVNLLSMIVFTLFDFYVLGPLNGFTGISSRAVIFLGGILSTVPLAYFIGMAVSSITAHTGSVAIGAVINATFGSIIEIILYAFGLMEGKEELVQGAMIGSFLLGLLALPGVAMFSGGLVRSEQRFNAKSATVTSTMLVVSVIGVFTPTIFQSIHGTYQFDCKECPEVLSRKDVVFNDGKTCRACRIYQPHPTQDPIYQTMTRPLMYICTIVLLLTYAIGLYFTLGTHQDQIYPKKKTPRKRQRRVFEEERLKSPAEMRIREYSNPPRPVSDPSGFLPLPHPALSQPGPSRMPKVSANDQTKITSFSREDESSSDEEEHGHENPGWSIFWSSVVLLGCTILYTLIAEVLIDCLDEIIEEFPISEKTLGLTIFAIVPTVTEFYNAIAFAVSGNIVLSLEIGSAYAIQVALVQIPVLVAFSAIWNHFGPNAPTESISPGKYLANIYKTSTSLLQVSPTVGQSPKSEFTLVFPKWEFYTILFSVFLLTYVYLEGKSNYFKGALLLLSYVVLIAAFFFEPSAIY